MSKCPGKSTQTTERRTMHDGAKSHTVTHSHTVTRSHGHTVTRLFPAQPSPNQIYDQSTSANINRQACVTPSPILVRPKKGGAGEGGGLEKLKWALHGRCLSPRRHLPGPTIYFSPAPCMHAARLAQLQAHRARVCSEFHMRVYYGYRVQSPPYHPCTRLATQVAAPLINYLSRNQKLATIKGI